MAKGIFIDGRLFDWGVDEQSYKEALLMGPKFQKAIETNIAYHFLESLSEFMDRKVTLTEVQEATKTGWIDK
jgi:aminopeptidase-like protein